MSRNERIPFPGDWIERAECRGADPSIFFGERGADDYDAARAYCAACSVADDCLDYALEAGPSLAGLWGGETAKSRNRIRAERGMIVPRRTA